MIVEVYNKNKRLICQEFDTVGFFVSPLVALADKYKVIINPQEYYENTIKGYEERKKRVLNPQELEKLRNIDFEASDEVLFNMLNKDLIKLNGKKEVKDFMRLLNNTKYGIFEDVICFFEENEIEMLHDSLVIIYK